MKTNLNNRNWTKVIALSLGLTLAVTGHVAFGKGGGGGGHGGGGHSGGGHSMSSRSMGNRSSGFSSSRGSSLSGNKLSANKLSSNLGNSQFKKSSLGQNGLSANHLRSGATKSGNLGINRNTNKNTGIAGNLKSNKNSGISNKIGKIQGNKSLGDHSGHAASHNKSGKHHGDHQDHGMHDSGFCHKNPHCKPCPSNHCCPHFCPGTYWWFPVGCWTYGTPCVNVVDTVDVVSVEQVVSQTVETPVAVDVPLDLQLKNIELLDVGNPQAGLGPVYRITILNASDVAIEQGFEVGLVVSNGEEPGEKSPFASERVEGIGAGELLFVEVQLPEVVNRMARTQSGQVVPFSTLFVAVDARQEISETEEGNNSAKVARTQVPVATDLSTASEF